MDDPRPARAPLLTRPFEAGATGWTVVFVAVVAELVGGAVTNQMSTAIALPVLVFPVAVAYGFAGVQWWSTAALILIAALLTRRSRIAAWAAIPLALAGCQLATHFLEQLLVYYNLSG